MEMPANADSTAAMPPQGQEIPPHIEDVAIVKQSGIKVRVMVTESNNEEGGEQAKQGDEVPSPCSNDSTEEDDLPIKNNETENNTNKGVERAECVDSLLCASESDVHKTAFNIDSSKIESDDKTDATVATSGYIIDSPPSNPIPGDACEVPQQSMTLESSGVEEKATEDEYVEDGNEVVLPEEIDNVVTKSEVLPEESDKVEQKELTNEFKREESQKSGPVAFEENDESTLFPYTTLFRSRKSVV